MRDSSQCAMFLSNEATNVDQVHTGKCVFIVETQTVRIQVITRLPATRTTGAGLIPPQQSYFMDWSVPDP